MSDVTVARLDPMPLRFIFPRYTQKLVARSFGIAVRTARDWLVDGVPAARRHDMARVVNAELDRIETDIRRYREGGGG